MSQHPTIRHQVGDYVTTDDGRTGLVTLVLNGWSRVRFHHGPARRAPREQTFREWDLKHATAEDERCGVHDRRGGGVRAPDHAPAQLPRRLHLCLPRGRHRPPVRALVHIQGPGHLGGFGIELTPWSATESYLANLAR